MSVEQTELELLPDYLQKANAENWISPPEDDIADVVNILYWFESLNFCNKIVNYTYTVYILFPEHCYYNLIITIDVGKPRVPAIINLCWWGIVGGSLKLTCAVIILKMFW